MAPRALTGNVTQDALNSEGGIVVVMPFERTCRDRPVPLLRAANGARTLARYTARQTLPVAAEFLADLCDIVFLIGLSLGDCDPFTDHTLQRVAVLTAGITA